VIVQTQIEGTRLAGNLLDDGSAAITEAARAFMVAFPDMRVLMDDLLMHGDKAEYRWTLVGTNTGPGGTGRRVRISGFEEWSIGGDGLIASSLGHYDQAGYERQLDQGVEEPYGL
jgi:hypothetical protein